MPENTSRVVDIEITWTEQKTRLHGPSWGLARLSFELPLPFDHYFPSAKSAQSARTMAKRDRKDVFRGHASGARMASEWALRTGRALQFMAATGLRQGKWPQRGPWPKLGGSSAFGDFDGIPNQDHSFFFRDPATRKLLMVNEPYDDAIAKERDRRDWKFIDAFDIRPMKWGNLYIAGAPIHSELVSLKGHGVDLDEVEARLESFGPAVQGDRITLFVHDGEISEMPTFPVMLAA